MILPSPTLTTILWQGTVTPLYTKSPSQFFLHIHIFCSFVSISFLTWSLGAMDTKLDARLATLPPPPPHNNLYMQNIIYWKLKPPPHITACQEDKALYSTWNQIYTLPWFSLVSPSPSHSNTKYELGRPERKKIWKHFLMSCMIL